MAQEKAQWRFLLLSIRAVAHLNREHVCTYEESSLLGVTVPKLMMVLSKLLQLVPILQVQQLRKRQAANQRWCNTSRCRTALQYPEKSSTKLPQLVVAMK